MTDAPQPENREQRLIDAVVSLAKSFREERDRLARRLSQLEREIDALTFKLDQHQQDFPATEPPGAPPPVPSRMRS